MASGPGIRHIHHGVKKMAKIYQLMTGRSQINGFYYDRDDAIESAKQHVRDTGVKE